MRKPEYMSPTSLKCFESNRREFYLRYLSDHRPPRSPQTKPMAVGSAFDGYVKSYLYYTLFGNYGPDDAYARDTIFEKQVEAHNREWAKDAGAWAFELYKKSGALADLMLELATSVNKPRFEFSIQDYVSGSTGSVPLLGKPDIFFINAEGCRVILDWKVNGFCAKSKTSPYIGHIMCRDSWLPSEFKPSQRNRMPHRECWPTPYKGIKINPTLKMEDVDDEWAAQLGTYAWLLGEEIGSQDLILGIEQLCGNPITEGVFPQLRCASHRCKSSYDFQVKLHQRYVYAWGIIQSGVIFEEPNSIELQASLDRTAEMLATGDPDSFETYCHQMSR